MMPRDFVEGRLAWTLTFFKEICSRGPCLTQARTRFQKERVLRTWAVGASDPDPKYQDPTEDC